MLLRGLCLGFVQLGLQGCNGLAGFFGQLFVNIALLLGLGGQRFFLLRLLAQQLGHRGSVTAGSLGAAELALQIFYLLLQGVELLAGVIGQLKGAGFEVWVLAKGAVKPQGHFTRDFEAFQRFAVANAVIDFMRGFIATGAQQVKHLPHLCIQPQAGIDGAQQLGLGGLQQLDAEPVGHVFGNGLG